MTFAAAQGLTHGLPPGLSGDAFGPSLPRDSRLPESAQLGSCLFLSLVADVTMEETVGRRPWAWHPWALSSGFLASPGLQDVGGPTRGAPCVVRAVKSVGES